MDFFGIGKDEQGAHYRKAKDLTSEENIVDQQYFDGMDDRTDLQHSLQPSSGLVQHPGSLIDTDLEEVDEQYFGHDKVAMSHPESLTSHASDLHDVENFIDQNYFGIPGEHDIVPLSNITRTVRPKRSREPSFSEEKKPLLQPNRKLVTQQNQNCESIRIAEVVKDVREKAGVNLFTGSNLELPGTTEKNGFQGRHSANKIQRILRQRESVNFNHLTADEAASVLAKSIIEVRENIIVLNKPYGMCTQPGPGIKHSIADLLPRLEHRLRKLEGKPEFSDDDVGEFLLAHRLDRECTGVMLVARNRDTCLKLQEAFAHHWFEKKYLCITSGIPETIKGAIQLPLIEKNFNGIYKMCVIPLNRRAQNDRRNALRVDSPNESSSDLLQIATESDSGKTDLPNTYYEMLDRRNGAALLTCSTTQGLKHQIRVHLSMGLHTPILGDHKYSHVKYLAPQRLSHRLLEQLNIRQSKVRHLPLYLHASHLQISQNGQMAGSKLDFMATTAKNGRTYNAPVHFFAAPPPHFLDMLRLIGLRLPRHLSKLL